MMVQVMRFRAETAPNALLRACIILVALGVHAANVYAQSSDAPPDAAVLVAEADGLVAEAAVILGEAVSDKELDMGLDKWARAMDLYERADARDRQARLLETMAAYYGKRGHVATAAQHMQRAAALWHGLKRYTQQAETLQRLASLYAGQDMFDDARTLYQDALTIYTALKDDSGRAGAMLQIGATYREQWMWIEALSQTHDALALFTGVRDTQGQARALLALAGMYLTAGDLDETRRLLDQARALSPSGAALRAQLSHAAADLALAQGDTRRALDNYAAEISLLQDAGDLQAAAHAQIALAGTLTLRGRPERALAYLASSMDVARLTHDNHLQGSALETAAETLHAAGRPERALELLDQAAALYRNAGELTGALRMGVRAAILAQESQDPRAASRRSLDALAQAREQNNARAEATLLMLNGNLLLKAGGDPQRARDFYIRAQNLCRAMDDKICLQIGDGNMGLAALAAGDLSTARELLEQAAADAASQTDRDSLWRWQWALGRLALKSADPHQAAARFDKAAAVLESGATPPAVAFAGVRFPMDPDTVFSNLTETLIDQDAPRHALAAVERHAAFLAVKAGFTSAPAAPYEFMLHAFPENQTAVTYWPGRDALYIFLIRNGDMQILNVGITREKLLALADAVLPGPPHAVQFDPEAARELHKALIEPVLPFLDDSDTLILAPPDFLLTVPFAALPDVEGRYLIERRAVAVSPDLTTFTALRSSGGVPASRPLRASVVIQQQPDCSGRSLSLMPRALCQSLTGKAFDTYRPVFATDTVFMQGEYAPREIVEKRSADSDLLHFETNCFVDGSAPGTASVVLFADRKTDPAADTFLELRDLSPAGGWPRLAALPHCTPVTGRTAAAPGYALLLRDLHARGAAGVIVSTAWPDQDAASAIMTRFYTRLRQGTAPAQAMRGAQIDMLNDPQFADPARWAPFLYSGIPMK